MPSRRAVATASVEGAETAQSTGIPATAAFWTSSKLARPETRATRLACGQPPRQKLRADELVHRVVAADVLAQSDELTLGREEARGVEPARLLEHGLAASSEPGSDSITERGTVTVGGDRRAAHLELVDRRLAADAAARRCVEVALRAARRRRARRSSTVTML